MPPVPVPGFTTNITFPVFTPVLEGIIILQGGAQVSDLVLMSGSDPVTFEDGYLVFDGDRLNEYVVTGNEVRILRNPDVFSVELTSLILRRDFIDYSHVACGSYSPAAGFTANVSLEYGSGLEPLFAADDQSTHVAVYAPDAGFEIESASCNNGTFSLVSLNRGVAIFESSTALVGITAQFIITAAPSESQQRSEAIGVTWLSS